MVDAPPLPQQQMLTLSKQTRSLCIRNLMNPSLLDEDPYKTDNEKFYRKYYSKKTRNLLIYFHSSHSVSKYSCKNIKQLKVYGSNLKRSPMPSVKTMTLFYGVKYSLSFRRLDFDPILHSRTPTFIDQISGFKLLETLTFYGGPREISLYQLRKLPSLRNLSLNLMIHQLTDNVKTLLRLHRLENFSLYVGNPNVNIGRDCLEETVEFIVELMSSKRFGTMILDLSKISFSNNLQALDTLLENLNTIKPTSFDIRLSLVSGTTIDANKLQTALNYLDLLILRSQTGHTVGLNNCDTNKNKITSLDQVQRKLDLTLPLLRNPVDPTKVHANQLTEVSESLNTLFGKLLEIPFLLNILSAQNLRSLAFPIHEAYMHKYAEICLALTEVFRNASELRQLTLEGYSIDSDENEDSKKINKAFDRISDLHALESLVIRDLLISDSSISTIGNLLAPLSGLKTLELNMNIQTHAQDPNIFLPLETLKNLQTLVLTFEIQGDSESFDLSFSLEMLDKLKSLRIFLPKLTQQSRINFVAGLQKLSLLETLAITQGSQLLKDSTIRSDLFTILSEKRNLKEFTLTTFTNSHAPLGQKSDTDEDENKKLILKMKNEIEQIFRQNANIERWHMIEYGSYEIGITR